MKQISYWAKNHIWPSRLLIAVVYILLNALGIFTGKLLKDIGINLPGYFFMLCVTLTILLWFGYSCKSPKPAIYFSYYFRRKLFDFCLGMVTFLMIVYGSNNYKNLFITNEG